MLDNVGTSNSCENSSIQAAGLRVVDGKLVKGKKSFDLQVHNKFPDEWRVVVSSVEKIELPRQSPDAEYLAYATGVPIRGRMTLELYLQKLSNGWREVVTELKVVPVELCFDFRGTGLILIEPSGTSVQQDLAPQIKLLSPR